MASLAKDPGGKKRIIFTHPDGKRKTIYLGKCNQATAQGIKYKVECLVTSKGSGEGLDPSVSAWVRELPNELAGKLARVGLIADHKHTTLGELIEAFLATRRVRLLALVVFHCRLSRARL